MSGPRSGIPPLPDYQAYLNDILRGRSPLYKPFEAKPPVHLGCERIAYYLPQFHRCAENDAFWGSGFTEWNNVVRCLPKFNGHYQPRLPGDLGFYDLFNEDTLARQVEIADNYGLTGFMFYYYWFSGRTVLETPIRVFLRRTDLRFKFCLMWANENWTRRWDGLEQQVLLGQSYSQSDAEQFIRHVLPYFADDRYLKVGERLLLAVYRADQIPQTQRYADLWREECTRAGLPEPYLVTAMSFSNFHPAGGFDAALEFPPHQRHLARAKVAVDLRERLQLFDPHFRGLVFHYDGLVESQLSVAERPFRTYRTAFPSWDNVTRRRDGGSWTFAFSTPARFQYWTEMLLDAELKEPGDFRMICFNAWNEWAEGAYLEPDSYFGYAYLDALYRAFVARSEPRIGE